MTVCSWCNIVHADGSFSEIAVAEEMTLDVCMCLGGRGGGRGGFNRNYDAGPPEEVVGK